MTDNTDISRFEIATRSFCDNKCYFECMYCINLLLCKNQIHDCILPEDSDLPPKTFTICDECYYKIF